MKYTIAILHKFMYEQKNKLAQKYLLFASALARILKPIVIFDISISNRNSRVFQISKFHAKVKIFKSGTNNALFGIALFGMFGKLPHLSIFGLEF